MNRHASWILVTGMALWGTSTAGAHELSRLMDQGCNGCCCCQQADRPEGRIGKLRDRAIQPVVQVIQPLADLGAPPQPVFQGLGNIADLMPSKGKGQGNKGKSTEMPSKGQRMPSARWSVPPPFTCRRASRAGRATARGPCGAPRARGVSAAARARAR